MTGKLPMIATRAAEIVSINPATLEELARFPIGTAAVLATPQILGDPNVVKVVTADDGRALYFSRAPIPFLRDATDAELLGELSRRDARIAIVSLKPRRAGELELDITGLRQLVDVSVWGDDVERVKPDPDGVLRAMRWLGVEAHTTLVIGDSPADILMGRAAGAQTAAALWGGAGPERLLAQAPDFALESPHHLLEMLNTNS